MVRQHLVGHLAGHRSGLVDRLVGRRARRNCRPARVVRVARTGSYAPRAARPDRLRDRLHGAGRRLPAPRHRPLPDLRPGPDRPRHGPASASGATRAHRSPRAVTAHRLLPVPTHDPTPDLAHPLVGARRAGRIRRLARRARDRPGAAAAPSLHRRLGALHDPRHGLPLSHRWPVPGLRRRCRQLSRRPGHRSTRTAATAGDALPRSPRDPRSLSRGGVLGGGLGRGTARLVGGALHGAHAGGSAQHRCGRASLLGSVELLPLPPHRSLSVLSACRSRPRP